MSVSMPSYFMYNLSNLDSAARTTIWESMSSEEQGAADTEWKALYNANKSLSSTGTTTISSEGPTDRFQRAGAQIDLNKDATFSATPTAAALTGYNALLSGLSVNGLIFADLKNADTSTDSATQARAAAAYSVMTGRFGGSQGLLGYDVDNSGAIDSVNELFGGTRTAGSVDFDVDFSQVDAGSWIRFEVDGFGGLQEFNFGSQSNLNDLAAAINLQVANDTLRGVSASVVGGKLRIAALDDTREMASGRIQLGATSYDGTINAQSGMRDVNGYFVDDGTGTMGINTAAGYSADRLMVLAANGGSTKVVQSASGLVNGIDTTISAALVMRQNQGARIDITI